MVGMHAFWWLFWVLLLVLVLFGIRPRSGERRERQRETPIDVLRRRLANGEINAQEYEEILQALNRDK
ncbi:MAG: SHOCT domain-containing protein [Burkholderiales bacterium]|nr:SHOCT domain-containing protein [Burkholderiales bacterium]